jgi:hypothetical protein
MRRKGTPEKESVSRVDSRCWPPETQGIAGWEIMLAKYSPNLEVFNEPVDREYPQYGKTLPLPFPEKLQELIEEVSQ